MYQIIIAEHQFSKRKINEAINYPVKQEFKYLFAKNDKTDWGETIWDTKEEVAKEFDLFKIKIYKSLYLFLTRFKGSPAVFRFRINLVLKN